MVAAIMVAVIMVIIVATATSGGEPRFSQLRSFITDIMTGVTTVTAAMVTDMAAAIVVIGTAGMSMGRVTAVTTGKTIAKLI
jgi:hypothetical protein